MGFRGAGILLVSLLLCSSYRAECQTQADMDLVAKITKREQTKSSCLAFLAGQSETMGDYKKAIDRYNALSEIYKNDPGIGIESVKYAWALSKVALCKSKMTQKDEAVKQSKEALKVIDGLSLNRIAADGPYLTMCRDNCKAVLGKEMPPPAPLKAVKAELRCIPVSDIPDLSRREKEAETLVKSSGKQEPKSLNHLSDQLYLANIYTLEKKYDSAEALYKQVISGIESKAGKNSKSLLQPLSNYGYMLKQSNREAEANANLKRMESLLK
ncbi:MAG: tetratricopeptide repeat protein [Candidatus Obscuribacterales bacterium]|nr:tetratricopeptide repeat protein [Candidatus Obscuribacterales bacterium]